MTITFDSKVISIFWNLRCYLHTIMVNVNTLHQKWMKSLNLTFDSKVISMFRNLCFNLHTINNYCTEYQHPLSKKNERGICVTRIWFRYEPYMSRRHVLSKLYVHRHLTPSWKNVKMSHCWKSHVLARIILYNSSNNCAGSLYELQSC